jgi:transketolase
MASLDQDSGHAPVLAQDAAAAAHPEAIERPMADALRGLAGQAVASTSAPPEEAPDVPAVMAQVATVLWSRYLKFDAADPHWPDRDRFVISAGGGAALLQALLHLTGHDRSGSAMLRGGGRANETVDTPPEWHTQPALTPIVNSPGQAFATAVGMALAERLLAARFGKSLVDHRTWVIAADADLRAGVSHETASLAGRLKLNKLTVLHVEITEAADSDTAAAAADETLKRFAAYGWSTRSVAGGDAAEIAAGLSFAMRSRKPTFIACRGGAAALGQGWRRRFAIPAAISARWSAAGARSAGVRRGWLKRLARHPLRAEFERVIAGRLPDGWHDAVASMKSAFGDGRPLVATHEASQDLLGALATALPELLGGSPERAGPHPGAPAATGLIGPGNYRGRQLGYGIPEHGMAAAMNGIAMHGGLIPYAATALGVSDAMQPALRLAARARKRVIHLLTHDAGAADGHSGGAHLPAGHLAGLRAVPNLYVYRPADAIETAECWDLALRRTDGPNLLVLTRRPVPVLRAEAGENRCARGAYVLAEPAGGRQATLIASGGEVAVALAARDLLARDGIAVAVVSLPCWELFGQQDDSYRASVLGGAPRVGVEAAFGFGWERWLGEDGCFTGATGDDAAVLQGADGIGGITAEAVVAAVMKQLGA